MVNAMDVEELRRSQRRYRAGRGRDHGSEEEEEDEECSTPSAENSDRNMASMLCVSMESVEQVGRRERFLQSTFESLSGGEELSPKSANSNSISAQRRNAGTIAAARQTRDADQNRRREELQRRIEETRQKLQNIGYRSMKGSQSINDLSSFPEPSQQGNTLPRSRGKEQTAVVVEKRHQPSKRRIKPRRPVSLHLEALQRSMTGHGGGGGLSPTDESTGGSGSLRKEQKSSPKSLAEKTSPASSTSTPSSSKDGTSLRRACSLSDLNKPAVPRRLLPAPPANGSGKKTGSERGGTSRPSSSSDNNGERHRRKSIDMRDDRGLERRRSTKSPGPGQPLSRLEQHERMLAERERERREAQRLASLGRQPSKSDLRPKSVTDDSDRDLPSYMRSTSASVKKEKLVSPGPERVRRRSVSQYTQSQQDLRIDRDEETSSEDDGRGKKRSSSTDRRGRESPGRGSLAGRAKSERDLSRE